MNLIIQFLLECNALNPMHAVVADFKGWLQL
jgi:hypothetical protein